ncbi:MAG: nuclear transport factor 2 family protein [bacterium]
MQQQVNAYNARDLEAFLATYSSEIELYNQPDELILSGMEKMRERYQVRFDSSPALHAAITNRIALGNYVIDRERVSGLPNGAVLNAVAIYEVQDGLIRRVWFVRE